MSEYLEPDEEILKSIKRSCGDCHRCCEGWLTGFAYGYEFNQGRPCQFLSQETHCTIYDRRPHDPCQVYQCEWLANPLIPEWMKPNQVNVIITGRKVKDFVYWDVKECGTKLDSSVLSWLFLFCFNNSINLVYQINGSMNYLGSSEFVETFREVYLEREQLKDTKDAEPKPE